MARNLITATIILSSAIAFAGQASALVITTGGIADINGDPTSAQSGATVETFDAQVGGFVQPWNWSAAGSIHIVSGNQSGQYAQPYGDTTNYYSVDPSVGAATVSFGGTYDYLGLYWGSVDRYNWIDLYLGNALVATVLGADASNPANGDQGVNGSTFINISDVSFDSAVFSSSGYAFEFDNLAIAQTSPFRTQEVPEPATLILFATALAGLGLVRKQHQLQRQCRLKKA